MPPRLQVSAEAAIKGYNIETETATKWTGGSEKQYTSEKNNTRFMNRDRDEGSYQLSQV